MARFGIEFPEDLIDEILSFLGANTNSHPRCRAHVRVRKRYRRKCRLSRWEDHRWFCFVHAQCIRTASMPCLESLILLSPS